MVFGFGKKKPIEQSPPPIQHEKTISIESIEKIIQETETPKNMQLIETAKVIKSDIESNRKKIHELIIQLENDDLKLDEIDKNLMIIAKRGKDAIVSTIKKETSGPLSPIAKYDNVLQLSLEINQMLKKIGDVLGLNSRIIHIFAKKYADNLKNEIAKIAENRNRLQISINHVEKIKEEFRNILHTKETYLEKRREILKKEQRKNEIISETGNAINKINLLENYITELKAKKEYQEFLDIKMKITETSQEKSGIKDVINTQFAKISRPLDRYAYISAFEKNIKIIMDQLIANPYDTVSRENKQTIVQILAAVEKSVLSGTISVKDTDKSIEHIQETITKLDEFINLKESHLSKLEELEKNLGVFDIKLLENKEKELQKTREDITSEEITKSKIDEEIRSLRETLVKTKNDMEERLGQITGVKTKIEA